LVDELAWLGANVNMAQSKIARHHLVTVLHHYTWCLPAHSQDIAFFDHAKLTSAIAACLYRYHQDDLSPASIQASTSEDRFCLLVGDLSGIQDYIFGVTTIGAGGIARRLRARSFYLSVLSDVLSYQVARQFSVPLGNVLMSSGGKFYVLLPNQGNVGALVDEIRHQVDAWLRETFNGEIAVNLAHVCFSGDQFGTGSDDRPGFGHLLTDLSFKLNREKRRRGQSILAEGDGWNEDAFVVERDFWGVSECMSCGKFPGDRPEGLCQRCERDAVLGKRLPQACYVAYYARDAGDRAIPMPFDSSVRVLSAAELDQVDAPYLVVKLNDPSIHELAGYPGSFRYLANYVPVEETGAQWSFSRIAGGAEGRPLLGYVKADVDYLGILFAQGLRRDNEGYDAAVRVMSLSRELDRFFSGWIQHLLSQSRDYRSFYTIFSGGDDVFLVGPWDKAAELACTIRDQFIAFVGGNSEITLSAGVLFTKDRYPISRAAEDAEEVLELSKEGSPTHDQKRNQITVLGDTFAWEEASHIFAEIDMLKSRSRHLKSAFLYDLIEYARLYRLWKEKQNVEGLRYKALFAYNIARNLRKGDRQLYEWADALLRSIHSERENLTMEHLGLIATYVLFARRGR
jgi:CRISPR-associated protein Csm1